MSEIDFERLFGRAGSPIAPDAEFEEDLWLRLEAAAATSDEPGSRHPGAAAGAAPAAVDEPVLIGRSSARRSILGIAAGLLVVAGVVGAALGGRFGPVDNPAATVPRPLDTLAVVSGVGVEAEAEFSAACARWGRELDELGQLSNPLQGDFGVDTSVVVTDVARRLAPIVAEFSAAAGSAVDRDITPVRRLEDVSKLFASEQALLARDRFNGARSTLPHVIAELEAAVAELAGVGIRACR